MNRNSFSAFFFIKRTKLLSNGEAPIRLRIRVNGIAVESQIKRSVKPELWDQATESCKGRDKKTAEINEYIRLLKLKLLTIHREYELSGTYFTARLLMDKLYGAEEKTTLIELFRKHNDEIRKLIGIDYERRTVTRYDTCCRYLQEMLIDQYGKDDVALCEIDGQLVRKFEIHLKTVRKCQTNTAVKYIKGLKKIIRMAIANGLMTKDPFYGIKLSYKTVVKDILSKEELDRLIKHRFPIKRLEQVRDVFVFCCFTGLAYIDVFELESHDIVADTNGNLWIKKMRHKTEVEFHVPLLKIPCKILDKYRNDEEVQANRHVLPVVSNQKMNSYLKEIADICGIEKNLSTHCARRTFAQTICNENGVAMDNIALLLGHADVKTTKRHYTRMSDPVLNNAMKPVRAVYE